MSRPQIISVSRRTDIPAFYADWFFNRIEEGFVLVPNPINPRQIRRVSLLPADVACLVFWSKNPAPMLSRLDQLNDYQLFFQLTLNGYGPEIEPGIPTVDDVIAVFRTLSGRYGSARMVWRYDPILLGGGISLPRHYQQFARLAEKLEGFTRQCTISFVDEYGRSARGMRDAGLVAPDENQRYELAAMMAATCRSHGMDLMTCAEAEDLTDLGIGHGRCIDGGRIAMLTGKDCSRLKDRSQRPACGCCASADIGMYNTCMAGCRYCYANYSFDAMNRSRSAHDPDSPMLVGWPSNK